MRPDHRAPLPDLADLLRAANELLQRHGLPLCRTLTTHGIDADTKNPVVAGIGAGRRYAIKAKVRFAESLRSDLAVANALARTTGLPIPAHLCCSDPGDHLQLLILDWVDGRSFTSIWDALPIDEVRRFFREWGSCMGRYHRASVPGLQIQSPGDQQAWWRAVADHQLRSQPWAVSRRRAIEDYLAPRIDALRTPAAPGPIKADDEPHDVLVEGSPPRISALIDWERVQLGDTACSAGMVYLRLRLRGYAAAWSDFLDGYAASGPRPPQCPQVEGVLMCRALRAAETKPEALAIVDDLLAGARLPFLDGAVA